MRSCARCRWVVLLGLAVINALLLAAGAFDFLSPTVVKSEGGGAPYGASQTLPAKGLRLAPGVPARALHTLHQGWVKRDGRRLPDSSIRVYQVSPEAHEAEYREQLASLDPPILRYRSGYVQRVPPGIDREGLIAAHAVDSSGPLYGLVQFTLPVQTAVRYELEEAGFRFYNYVPEGGLLARIPAGGLAQLERLQDQNAVRYAGPIPWEARLEADLLAQARDSTDERIAITLALFDPPDALQLAQLETLLAVSGTSLHRSLPLLAGRIRAGDLLQLARLPYVRWIERERPATVGNLESTMLLGSDLARALEPLETTGAGVQAAVIDSGIANDPFHIDLPAARIIDQYDFVNNDAVAGDDNGHGTHVAGTVGGSGEGSSGANQGHAPGVEFLIYRLSDEEGIGFYPTAFQNALVRGTGHGLDLANCSFGALEGIYEIRSEIADRAVRGEYGDRYLTMVTATGNSGGAPYNPALGKNVISVGAVTDGNWPYDVVSGACGAFSIWPPATRTCYSSHGPVDTDGDGQTRVKPDVTAPGTMIVSPVPGDEGDSYGAYSGTSMAAPAVSGVVASFMDNYAESDDDWIFDWPEITKAIIIGSALPVGDDVHGDGHGLVDALGANYVLNGINVPGHIWGDVLDNSLTEIQFEMVVPAGYRSLRLVLTWSDPAGAAEVAHNLDLRVYSNATCSGTPLAQSRTEDDTVELVDIAAGQTAGTWCAKVSAVSLTERQPFALAYTGLLQETSAELQASVEPVDGYPQYRHVYTWLSNVGATAGGSFVTLQVPAPLSMHGAWIYTADGRALYYPHNRLHHPPGDTWYAATGTLAATAPRLVVWLIGIPPETADGTYSLQAAGGYRLAGATVPVAGVSATMVVVDDYEPDDGAEQAAPIGAGEAQDRSLVPAGDVDWVTFSLHEPAHFMIGTAGETGDTIVSLYDSDEQLIVTDDDSGEGGFSRIERSCDLDEIVPAGDYWIKVENGGVEELAAYDLTLQIYAYCSGPTVTPTSTMTPTPSPTPDATPQPPEWRHYVPIIFAE